MKTYRVLAAFGFAVLACASVWLGGLNQDEGWYLYAARLVAEGRMPYRDFFFTQGPVMPMVYSAFSAVWGRWGLLGARILTLSVGTMGILLAAGLARRLVPEGRRPLASLLVLLLLGSNLYHLYYLTIPKAYALAALFSVAGFYLLSFEGAAFAFAAGLSLAFAAGTRISLGVLLAVVGVALLARSGRLRWLWFGLGGAAGLAVVYGPFVAFAWPGLVAAQKYHAGRGGFDIVFTVGSLSRLVRWYLPVFVLLAAGLFLRRSDDGSGARRASFGAWLLLAGFAAVFAVQILAPFPYEDYQVPVMWMPAVAAVARVAGDPARDWKGLALVTLFMTWTLSFGSPLLEKWMVNGQDRFWSLKKAKPELAQLRDVARRINEMDPGGGSLLTQDLYLAIETGRKVPDGLEMGPFSYWGDSVPSGVPALDDSGMRRLLEGAPCEIAAMSGYAFAITVPGCFETPIERQIGFWRILTERYDLVFKEDGFGQNSTPLMVLRRKKGAAGNAGAMEEE